MTPDYFFTILGCIALGSLSGLLFSWLLLKGVKLVIASFDEKPQEFATRKDLEVVHKDLKELYQIAAIAKNRIEILDTRVRYLKIEAGLKKGKT